MRALFVVLGLALLAPSAGMAQDRHGFWFDLGLGYGSAGCSGCGARDGGLSGGLALGGTISPHVLLGIGTTGWYKDYGGGELTLGTLDARMHYYPSLASGFFLTAGLGVGAERLAVDGFGSASETGLGVVGGLGYDIPLGSGSVNLTPYLDGFLVRTSADHLNVGRVGLAITIRQIRAAEPVSTTPPSRYMQPGFQSPAAQVPAAPPPAAAPPTATPQEPAPQPSQRPAVGYTKLPPGTNYVGDTRIKVYYPLQCGAQHAIPPGYQSFFQSEEGAMDDGFTRSGDC